MGVKCFRSAYSKMQESPPTYTAHADAVDYDALLEMAEVYR